MKTINIFDILYKEMIFAAFDGNERIRKALEKDVNKDTEEDIHWAVIKDSNIWFAELAQQCDNFLRNNFESYPHLHPIFVYSFYYSKEDPRVEIQYFLQIDISIEDENGDEEIVNEQANGIATFYFKPIIGDLVKIIIEEHLTGEEWELWPDTEDFTTDMIYLDKDQADAEGIGW